MTEEKLTTVQTCLLKDKDAMDATMSFDQPRKSFLQFFIREDKLNLYVREACAHIILHLPYSIPFYVYLQYSLLHSLYAIKETYRDIEIGTICYQAGILYAGKDELTKLYHELVIKEEIQEEDQMELFNKAIKKHIEWHKMEDPESSTEISTEEIC